MGKRLLRIEAKLRNMRDTTAIAESSSSSSDLIKIYTRPPSIRPEIYGFEVQLQEIKDLLGETQDGNSIKAIWIVGMAGIGKTALAKKVFDEVKNQFNLTFWVQLSEKLKPKNQESRAEIIRKILEHFKGSATADASQDVLLQALHQKLQNKRYLIVLDNIWHLSDWDEELGSSWSLLSHCLPEGGGGAIIITSREEQVASRVMGEHNVIRLHPTFDAQSCWSIFMDSLHMKEIVTQKHNSTLERMKNEIVDECYGLPLAATILGDVISYQLCREQFWLDPSVKKLMRLSLHANHDDDSPLQQAVDETLKLLPGVENIDIGQKSVTVTASCEPKVILQRLGRFWRTQLISVKELRHKRKWNQRRK
ncbi:hypothetical protein F0562_011991 [Nyssa sinensis]|uniref:NB-ARC domain-containing protein n=1 Tax=Nyssa sinensis TaxID=561372 RepID=A0A5J4ZUG6_9ASTE|nr:hypothetical protein F0562_011991 [Nyssa sinensis]